MISESHCVNLVAVGDDGALITDPAFASQAESLKKAIAKITNKLATMIVLFRERHVGGRQGVSRRPNHLPRRLRAGFRPDVSGQAPKKVDMTFLESFADRR